MHIINKFSLRLLLFFKKYFLDIINNFIISNSYLIKIEKIIHFLSFFYNIYLVINKDLKYKKMI